VAGLPELNGVYGTFSGTRGLNLTPLQMKQKQRMFLAELAAEAERLKTTTGIQSRGLDLEERGQDLQTQENELARTFANNLNKNKQDFDAAQQAKAEEAAVAAQQRAIQAQQQQQGSAQGFAREEGAAERAFRGQEGEAERALRREGMGEQKRQFGESLGFEREKFDFGRDIELRDQGRKDRAEALNAEIAELGMQSQRGEIDQRQAQTALILKQVELTGLELREALEDTGLSADQYGIVAEALASGEDLPPEIAGKVMKSTKALKAVTALSDLMSAASERGLMPAKRESLAAETELTKLKTKAVRDELEKTPEQKAADPEVSEEEVGLERALLRAQEAGEIDAVGEAQLKALAEIKSLGTATDPDAVDRRKKLRAFNALTRGMEGEDMSNMSFDITDGILLGSIVGIPAFFIKKGVEGLDRLTDDEKQTAIRKMADELGLD
jgi:hypothetical protein